MPDGERTAAGVAVTGIQSLLQSPDPACGLHAPSYALQCRDRYPVVLGYGEVCRRP
jgi:hypothetical protein